MTSAINNLNLEYSALFSYFKLALTLKQRHLKTKQKKKPIIRCFSLDVSPITLTLRITLQLKKILRNSSTLQVLIEHCVRGNVVNRDNLCPGNTQVLTIFRSKFISISHSHFYLHMEI